MPRLGPDFKRAVNQLIVGYLGREKYIATANALIKESGLDDYSNDRLCEATLEEIVAEFQSRRMAEPPGGDADARAPEEPQPQNSSSPPLGSAVRNGQLESLDGDERWRGTSGSHHSPNDTMDGALVESPPPSHSQVSPSGPTRGLSTDKGDERRKKRATECERTTPKGAITDGGKKGTHNTGGWRSPSGDDQRHSFSPPPNLPRQNQPTNGSGAKRRRRESDEVERYEQLCRERHAAKQRPVADERKKAPPPSISARAPLRSPPVVVGSGDGAVMEQVTIRPSAPASDALAAKRTKSPHRSALTPNNRKPAPPHGGYTKPLVNLDNLLGLSDTDNDGDDGAVERRRDERRPAPTTVAGIPVPYDVKKFGGSLTGAKLGMILNKAERALAVATARQAEMNRARQSTMRPSVSQHQPSSSPGSGTVDAPPDYISAANEFHSVNDSGGFSGVDMEKLRRLTEGPIAESLIDKALDMAHGIGGN